MSRVVLLFVVLHAVCSAVQGELICPEGEYLLNDKCKQCPYTCSICDSERFCTKCNDGYYGEACSRECNANCRNKKCDKSEGECISCSDGFFKDVNKNCVLCAANCSICISATQCSHCKAGFKGRQCQELCTNCKPGTECDQTTGECRECKQGLTGAACAEQCDSKCSSCHRLQGNKCIGCSREKYGTSCENDCSINCLTRTCYDADGTCTYGCEDGYWGNSCDHKCFTGCKITVCDRESGLCNKQCLDSLNYTQCNCPVGCSCDTQGTCHECDLRSEFMCGKHCKGGCQKKICLRNTSSCPMGCEDGYTGNLCNKQSTNLVGLAFALPLLAVIGVAATLISKCISDNSTRRTRGIPDNAASSLGVDNPNRSSTEFPENAAGALTVRRSQEIPDEDEDSGSLKGNNSTRTRGIPDNAAGSLGVSVKKPAHRSETEAPLLEQTRTDLEEMSQNNENEYRDEVANATNQTICDDKEVFLTEFKKLRTEEVKKDMTVPPASDSLVYVLSDLPEKKSYIVCSDKLARLPDKFWSTVWQRHCKTIIQLTRREECTSDNTYWPEKSSDKYYGSNAIKVIDEKQEEKFIFRKLRIKKNANERTVIQMHFFCWPENGLPEKDALTDFLANLRNIKTNLGDQIMVHCSDGVTRSGIFVAIDILIDELETGRDTSVPDCVRHLRNTNRRIIETLEQYEFLYQFRAFWISRESQHGPSFTV